MLRLKVKSPWASAIAVLEDNIFSNDLRRWGSAVAGIDTGVDTTVTPASKESPSYHEKRKEPRFSISLPVFHRLKGSWKKYKVAESVDVSQNGIRISVEKPVPIGTKLQMKIKLPEQKRKVKMEGVVVWQKPSWNSSALWECGVAFENLRKLSKKERIIAFMADRLCTLALKENHGMTCRPVRTRKDLMAAYHLVYQEYMMRGYCKEDPSELHYSFNALLPGSQTFLLEHRSRVIGTLSLIADSACGLPMENLFKDRISKQRKEGKKLGEVSLLALDHRFFGKKSFALTDLKKLAGAFLLFKILFDYARQIEGITDLFIAMHPRHKELYHYLQFNPIGPSKSYAGAQGKPALPMHLDIVKAVAAVADKHSIRGYFVDQMTPKELLENAFKWDSQTLNEFLYDLKPVWNSLQPTQQECLQKLYPNLLQASW